MLTTLIKKGFIMQKNDEYETVLINPHFFYGGNEDIHETTVDIFKKLILSRAETLDNINWVAFNSSFATQLVTFSARKGSFSSWKSQQARDCQKIFLTVLGQKQEEFTDVYYTHW